MKFPLWWSNSHCWHCHRKWDLRNEKECSNLKKKLLTDLEVQFVLFFTTMHQKAKLSLWITKEKSFPSWHVRADAVARQRRRIPSSELTRPLRHFCICVVRLVLACTICCVFSFLFICITKISRFHVGMGLFSNRSQKTSTCGKNISDTLACNLCATSLLLPQDGAKTTHIFLKHMY